MLHVLQGVDCLDIDQSGSVSNTPVIRMDGKLDVTLARDTVTVYSAEELHMLNRALNSAKVSITTAIAT